MTPQIRLFDWEAVRAALSLAALLDCHEAWKIEHGVQDITSYIAYRIESCAAIDKP
jgi:hypothetical protein